VWEGGRLLGAYSSPEVAFGARDTALGIEIGPPEYRRLGIMRFRVRTDPSEITVYTFMDHDPDTGDTVKWPDAAWWDDERQEWQPDDTPILTNLTSRWDGLDWRPKAATTGPTDP
jgi:hypothetical protein